jgi:L,D-transpeptidase-like protein/putative peptidoglycan binding protein
VETSAELKVSVTDLGVTIELPWRDGELYRSFNPVRMGQRENRTSLKVEDRHSIDRDVPAGVTLHYLARKPGRIDLRAQITVPPQELPPLVSPCIEIDKTNYVLRIVDGENTVKRYPIALGGDPENRKFCQDMKSSPEGWYEVYNLQPNATFFKALDLDYPRPIDRVRHQVAIESGRIEPSRPIGGEIQIHGRGVAGNWTAGCIALRDEDLTEIFNDPAIKPGVEVFITGSQIEKVDREWLKSPPSDAVKKVQTALKQAELYQGVIDGQFGNGTALALGRYQVKNGLPDSCQIDRETREHFGIFGSDP